MRIGKASNSPRSPKRLRRLVWTAGKPLGLLKTLLHLLNMRTLDVFTSVPRDRLRRARHDLLTPGGPDRVSRVSLRRGKCLENPLDCAACMRSCPEGVFFTYPKNRQHGRVCDEYELVAAFKSRCTGCGVCVESCPRGALRLG